MAYTLCDVRAIFEKIKGTDPSPGVARTNQR